MDDSFLLLYLYSGRARWEASTTHLNDKHHINGRSPSLIRCIDNIFEKMGDTTVAYLALDRCMNPWSVQDKKYSLLCPVEWTWDFLKKSSFLCLSFLKQHSLPKTFEDLSERFFAWVYCGGKPLQEAYFKPAGRQNRSVGFIPSSIKAQHSAALELHLRIHKYFSLHSKKWPIIDLQKLWLLEQAESTNP